MALEQAQQPVTAKGAYRDITNVRLASSMVFVPAIASVANVVVMIEQVHIVVLITEERVHLRANCAAQHKILLRKQRDQANRIDQFNRDRAVILGSGRAESEGNEIAPTTIDRRSAILVNLSRFRCAVHLQDAEDTSYHQVCISACQTYY